MNFKGMMENKNIRTVKYASLPELSTEAKQFMKYSNISLGSATEPTLVLYNDLRSHISNVILLVLRHQPATTASGRRYIFYPCGK